MPFTGRYCNKNTCTTFRSKGSVRTLWTSILASPTTPSSTFFLPIAFLSSNFLSLTLQSRPVLYLIPQFLEALKPRSPYPHCPTRWRYQRLSKALCLTLYPTNHSPSTLVNEALYWYSSSSIRTDISNRQPSVSVDLHHSLDNAKPNPFELESLVKTESFGLCFLYRPCPEKSFQLPRFWYNALRSRSVDCRRHWKVVKRI